MNDRPAVLRMPDLSARQFSLTTEREFPAPASSLFEAWTRRLDLWFAAPGSVLMRPAVNEPFFFETEFKAASEAVAQRHPHYGRFLQLVPERLVQLTWVTGAGGTDGAETVVTVELESHAQGTRLRLSHAGFASEAARDAHERAWPAVLEQLQKRLPSAG